MYKIALVNMPFGSLCLPSIGLTQLQSVIASSFGDQVSVDIHYLNHDFAHYIGTELYENITDSFEHLNSGLGDWFFREVAFPFAENNTGDYFARYYPAPSEETLMFKSFIQEKRNGVDEYLIRLMKAYGLDQANLVGFTSMFSQNVACFAMAKKIKDANRDVIIAMGGANCESPMGEEIVRNIHQIDFVFSGPALKSFPAFLRTLLDPIESGGRKINGLFSRANGPTMPIYQAANSTAAPLGQPLTVLGQTSAVLAPAHASPPNHLAAGVIGEELDINTDIPLDYAPFLKTLAEKFPNNEVDPVLLFETSRGCWWGEKAHCTFCGLNGATMAYRQMAPEKALKQFDWLFSYVSQCRRYNCVDNIMAKEYLKEVFPFVHPPSTVHLFYEVKADLSEEDLQTLSQARVKIIQPGVESLATSTLKLMKKGTNVFQNLSLLKNCLIYDVCPEWNLLVGFPGEGEETYKKYLRDLPSLMHLPPPHGVFPVRFDRYSPYFVKAKEYELDLRPLDFYEMTYPFDSAALANLAYYFSDINLRARYLLAMLKWLSKIRAKFDMWWERWHEPNGGPYPKLHFKKGEAATLVYDSRSGKPLEHRLSDTAAQLLEFLNKPKRLADMQAAFNHVARFDAGREIAALQDRGLVFEESERYMSLVLPQDLPPMSFTP